MARLQLLIMDEHRALRRRNTSALFVSGGETSSNQSWTLRYLRPSVTALANGMLAQRGSEDLTSACRSTTRRPLTLHASASTVTTMHATAVESSRGFGPPIAARECLQSRPVLRQ